MNENTRYQYKIEVIDAELNLTIGSKMVKIVDEAIHVLGYDTNLWIQDYERNKRQDDKQIYVDNDDERDSYEHIEELETMTPEEKLAEEQLHRTYVYEDLVKEQQS